MKSDKLIMFRNELYLQLISESIFEITEDDMDNSHQQNRKVEKWISMLTYLHSFRCKRKSPYDLMFKKSKECQ